MEPNKYYEFVSRDRSVRAVVFCIKRVDNRVMVRKTVSSIDGTFMSKIAYLRVTHWMMNHWTEITREEYLERLDMLFGVACTRVKELVQFEDGE